MKKLLLSFAMVLGLAAVSVAQQKIAYIDAEAVVQAMPEYARAKSEVEAYGKQLQKQLESKQLKMQQYYQEVMEQAQQGVLTPKQQQEAEAKLMQMQEDLQKSAAQADESLIAKEAELTKPMYEKFDAGIKAMAKANGFNYVLDKKLMLYSEGGIDATAKLKTQLGIQ